MLTFAPDAEDIAPEVLTAVSAVPTQRGYKTPPGGVDLGGAQFSGTSTGAAFLTGLDGTSRTFIGTSTYIYEYVSSSWTDRSRAGNYSSGSARWRFAQFGATSLAINKSTVLQSSTSGAFANVANSPKAACMEVVEGFVILGDTDDIGLGITGGPNSDQGHRWWCSQLFNPTGTWAPAPSTQATTGLLVDTPGKIVQLRRLGQFCIAYKFSSIYVGAYTKDDAVWTWRCVSTSIGTSAPDSVVSVGREHYFIGDSDIYVFNGQDVKPIGAGVKEWFFNRLTRAYASNILSLHDRTAKLIYWFYPSDGTGTLKSVLVYHYDTGRFGAFDLSLSDVVETVTGTITYDSLGSIYSTYDSLPNIPYDSPFWNAGSPVLAYLSSTNYLTSLSGALSSMTMTTGWFGAESAASLCTKVRPRMRSEPTSGSLTSFSLDVLGETPETRGSSVYSRGRFDVLQSARFHKFALTLNGSCEIEAISPTLQPDGEE